MPRFCHNSRSSPQRGTRLMQVVYCFSAALSAWIEKCKFLEHARIKKASPLYLVPELPGISRRPWLVSWRDSAGPAGFRRFCRSTSQGNPWNGRLLALKTHRDRTEQNSKLKRKKFRRRLFSLGIHSVESVGALQKLLKHSGDEPRNVLPPINKLNLSGSLCRSLQ